MKFIIEFIIQWVKSWFKPMTEEERRKILLVKYLKKHVFKEYK